MNELLAVVALTTIINGHSQPEQHHQVCHHQPHQIVHVNHDRQMANTHRELSRIRYHVDTVRHQKRIDGRSAGMIYDALRGQR